MLEHVWEGLNSETVQMAGAHGEGGGVRKAFPEEARGSQDSVPSLAFPEQSQGGNYEMWGC